MQLPNVVGLMKVGKAFVQTNRPEILLGTSIAASVGSTVMAAIGGYRSGKHVAKLEQEKDEPLSKAEIITETWQNYVPAAGLLVGSVAGTVGLHAVHVKDKKAIVATALAAVEEVRESAREYVQDLNEAVEDNTTPKNREKIRESLLEKSAERNDGVARIYSSDGVIEELYLVRDARTGRDIWSNQLTIEQALVELNEEIVHDGEADLNTFYSHAGINDIPDGDDYGWTGGDKVHVKWSTVRKDDGRPVCVFTFDPAPRRGYDKSR